MAQTSETFRGEFPLPDLDATTSLGRAIASGLGRGDAVALWGDLGAGKTTLARAILQALGVKEDVPSPTFTIVQNYETSPAIAHYDLYRLKSAREMSELGFEDALDTQFNSGMGLVRQLTTLMVTRLYRAQYAFYNLTHHAETLAILPQFERAVGLSDVHLVPYLVERGAEAMEQEMPYLLRLLAASTRARP